MSKKEKCNNFKSIENIFLSPDAAHYIPSARSTSDELSPLYS